MQVERRVAPAANPLMWVGLAAAAFYATVAAGLVRQWYSDPATLHGVLLVAAAVFVVRTRWTSLRTLPLAPHNGGFLLLAFAMAVYAVGTLTGEIFLLRLSLPFTAAGMILALGGSQHLRILLAPIGLLLLAIPLPAVVATTLTLPLQLIASQVAAGLLQIVQIPVTRAGNLLALPNITLEVAEACSGLRSVQSLVSVAAVCAAIVPLSASRGLLMMGAAIPIAVVGNGFRVAATGVLTTWIGEAAVRGTFHELTGFVAFVAMCAVSFLLLFMTRSHSAPGHPGSAHPRCAHA
jgi:exosortase